MPLEFEPLDIWCDGVMDLPEHFFVIFHVQPSRGKTNFFFVLLFAIFWLGFKKKVLDKKRTTMIVNYFRPLSLLSAM